MNAKLNAQSILIVLLLSILIFVSTDSNVQGQISGDDIFLTQDETGTGGVIEGDGIVPGGPGFIMVSAHDFNSLSNTIEMSFSMGANLRNPSPTEDGNYSTGLTLPHGATITKVTLYYRDNDATENMIVSLSRTFGGGQSGNSAILSTSDSVPSFRFLSQTTILYPVIDNQSYSYYLTLHLPADTFSTLLFTSVRIDYGYTASVPLVMK